MQQSPKNKPKVLVSIPNRAGWIHKHCVFALMKLQRDERVNSTFILPTNQPLVSNLHKIINDVLDGGYDYWISFDDDNPPQNNVFDLIKYDLDVAGCPTPVWANRKKGDFPIYFNALNEKPGGWTPHMECRGLQEVDAIGAGCFCVARRVLEALKDAPPHERWFADSYNERGEMLRSGDYLFCQRAKAAGFKIWAHYDYHCLHFNEIELCEVKLAFQDVEPA